MPLISSRHTVGEYVVTSTYYYVHRADNVINGLRRHMILHIVFFDAFMPALRLLSRGAPPYG